MKHKKDTNKCTYTKAEIADKIDSITSSITDKFVLDELAKYAIANDTSTTSTNAISSSTAVKTIDNLSTLSLNSRRNCI